MDKWRFIREYRSLTCKEREQLRGELEGMYRDAITVDLYRIAEERLIWINEEEEKREWQNIVTA